MVLSTQVNEYKSLGNFLLGVCGQEKSQKWLAQKTYVSQEAVHYWITGQSRPRPERLGRIAALFNVDPNKLASLANYDNDPVALDKVYMAYNDSRLISQ